MDPLALRRPCYVVHEDHGLLSLADLHPCFSGNFTIPSSSSNHHYPNTICHSAQVSSHRGGFRVTTYGSPRSIPGRSYDARWWFEDARQRPHFLEACFLCKKLLGNNRDIFMYRGDTAFCSEECRQEQIDIDESKEKKKINLSSSSLKALRKQQQEPTNRDYKAFHPGAIAAA